jgi:hypothetical protein
MEVFFLVFLEGGFYDFVAYFLVFFVFDYGCVHVWFLEGVDFLERRWFFRGTAYYDWCLWLLESAMCFCVLLSLRFCPFLG